jgi:hypothetical protein
MKEEGRKGGMEKGSDLLPNALPFILHPSSFILVSFILYPSFPP